MRLVESIEALRESRRTLVGRVGLVPTMGALHAGHISLVQQALADNDAVLATIFVNPTQFGPNEDLGAYPRSLERDVHMLREAGVAMVFAPTSDLMYPPGYQTYIDVLEIAQGLEGAHRPGHFRGVATIVAKIFNLAQPDSAYFGQKDAQQVAVIKRMTRDLNFPVELVVCPTVREEDGLAMSSRNAYLDPDHRRAATVLFRSLQAAASDYAVGVRDPEQLRETMRVVLGGEPLAQTEYVSVASARTLIECEAPTDEPLLVSLAVRVGRARLIDNCLLPLALNNRQDLSSTLGD